MIPSHEGHERRLQGYMHGVSCISYPGYAMYFAIYITQGVV